MRSDAADICIEAHLAYNLSRFSAKKAELAHSRLVPEGYCHHCFEEVDEPQLFCNNVCASSYRTPTRN